MSKFIMYLAATSFLTVTAHAAPTGEPNERPEERPGSYEAVRTEVAAGKLLSSHDLTEIDASANHLISVTAFPSSGAVDGSSREDY